MKLTMYWKTYNLNLIRDKYSHNNRVYLGLVDSDSWEPFADISINDTSVDVEDNRVLVNPDFLMCFESADSMVEWLEKNLWYHVKKSDWYYVLLLSE